MALPVRQQLIYWGIATAVFLFILWTLGDVILPFLVGGAIAYFLDPVADRLERMGLSRILATIIVVFFFLTILVVLVALVVIPVVVQQTIGLIQAAPGIIDSLRAFLRRGFRR
jgi:predicted PurR-regulated permease PerM